MLADSHLMVGLSNQLTLDIGNQPSRAFERSRRIVECFLLPDQQQRRYLHAAQLLADVPGCELYVINISAAETDTVWVTEVWSSQAELDASLTLDSVKALVEQVVPLLAEPPERVDILPVGGKGLDAE